MLSILLYALTVSASVPPGILPVPVVKTAINTTDLYNSLLNRDSADTEAPLHNFVYRYIATVALGTPAQNVDVLLDTGSADLWVFNSSGSHNGGYYDAAKSSSYNLYQKGGFVINYEIGDAKGDWVHDTVSLNGASVEKYQFGNVYQTTKQLYGTLGVGRESLEAVNGGARYPNFPVALKAAGHINRVAYSLYLADPKGSEGTILFGGVDKSKYTGQLKTVPFTSKIEFAVDFDFDGHSLNGVLDSGTSFFTLPEDIFDDFFYKHPHFNLSYNGDHWYTTEIPKGDGISLSFSGIDIKIPQDGLFFKYPGSSFYTFGLWPNNKTGGHNYLGDTVLRYAYTVYDLESAVAGIAQANLNPADPDLVVINDAIPNAVPA